MKNEFAGQGLFFVEAGSRTLFLPRDKTLCLTPFQEDREVFLCLQTKKQSSYSAAAKTAQPVYFGQKNILPK
ncbi:hypothetical protein ABEW32_08825 [Paenibacillus jamilae]|uniref:hypothetical protein n=1 Tax=Paenibacillus jamilae TaxID=114136 RepID=UPI003D2660C6